VLYRARVMSFEYGMLRFVKARTQMVGT
jgi:hypothetical protein